MPDDFDALIAEITGAAEEQFRLKKSTPRYEAAVAALRARLAPTTHADDEALVGAHDAALYDLHDLPEWGSDETRSKRQAVVDAAANAILSRLAELRARAEKAEVRVHELTVAFDQQDMALDGARGCLDEQTARAEKAERALAECRDKVIDECAALIDRWDAPENAANLIRKLKTKEPRT